MKREKYIKEVCRELERLWLTLPNISFWILLENIMSAVNLERNSKIANTREFHLLGNDADVLSILEEERATINQIKNDKIRDDYRD